MNLTSKRQLWALFYFAVATLFTGGFIASTPYSFNTDQFILSMIVSFCRWGIQIAAAFILLREERWNFIKDIGFVYLLGSCILLPFVILTFLKITNDLNLFIGFQLLSIIVMIFQYLRAVNKSGLNLIWWIAWVACQIIAIILQVTVVFHAL